MNTKALRIGGIPTLAEIEAEYKDSAYLDSHKRVQFDVKFVID